MKRYLKKIFPILILMLIWNPGHAQNGPDKWMRAGELKEYLGSDDKLWVVNYWASWCKPCVQELPYFYQVASDDAYRDIHFVLVSLDNLTKSTEKVQEVLQDYGDTFESIVLNEKRSRDFIDLLNPEWGGAIPMTELRFGDKIITHEGEISLEELKRLINKILSK